MNSDTVIYLLVVAYCVWAIYSGWKIINGRFEFLEEECALNKILKILTVLVVGSVFGLINMLILVFKGIFKFLDFMRKM